MRPIQRKDYAKVYKNKTENRNNNQNGKQTKPNKLCKGIAVCWSYANEEAIESLIFI